eukprot:jgi/Hompol1/5185/HPOL_001919-RA
MHLSILVPLLFGLVQTSVSALSLFDTLSSQDPTGVPQLTKSTIAADAIVSNPALTSLLQSGSNITVFLPTNEAFGWLGVTNPDLAGKLVAGSPALQNLVAYYVVQQLFEPTADGRYFFKAFNGQTLRIDVNGSNVNIGTGLGVYASVEQSIPADSNSVIHVVDALFMPPQALSTTLLVGGLYSLLTVVAQTGLVEAVDGLTDITVAAPTDAAFAAANKAFKDAGVTPSNGLLSSLVDLHLVKHAFTSNDVDALAVGLYDLTTGLPNEHIVLNVTNTTVTAAAAGNTKPVNIIQTDIVFDGGFLHIVDAVFVPSLEAVNAAQQTDSTVLPDFL